jgi:hypothetical protein
MVAHSVITTDATEPHTQKWLSVFSAMVILPQVHEAFVDLFFSFHPASKKS